MLPLSLICDFFEESYLNLMPQKNIHQNSFKMKNCFKSEYAEET